MNLFTRKQVERVEYIDRIWLNEIVADVLFAINSHMRNGANEKRVLCIREMKHSLSTGMRRVLLHVNKPNGKTIEESYMTLTKVNENFYDLLHDIVKLYNSGTQVTLLGTQSEVRAFFTNGIGVVVKELIATDDQIEWVIY